MFCTFVITKVLNSNRETITFSDNVLGKIEEVYKEIEEMSGKKYEPGTGVWDSYGYVKYNHELEENEYHPFRKNKNIPLR